MNDDRHEPPFEGGSQPVPEQRAEVPKAGRSIGQTLIIGLGVLVLLAALLWILVPFAG